MKFFIFSVLLVRMELAVVALVSILSFIIVVAVIVTLIRYLLARRKRACEQGTVFMSRPSEYPPTPHTEIIKVRYNSKLLLLFCFFLNTGRGIYFP